MITAERIPTHPRTAQDQPPGQPGRRRYTAQASYCLVVAGLTAITAGLGVFARGDGSTRTVTSVRGETYEMVTTGVYANNSERVVAEGVGWDLVTLALVVPLLILALPALRRGSVRGRVVALGALAYVFYQYLMYALSWAFGPLFLLFTVLFSSAAAGITWLATDLRASDAVPADERRAARFPGRAMAIFSWVVAAGLSAMWLARIVAGWQGDWERASLEGETTLVVQALDLGLLIPLAVLTGVLTWRRLPWGYVLGPVFAVKALTMSAAITAMLLSAWVAEGAAEVAPLLMFGAATLVSLGLAVRMVHSVGSRGGAREP